jgi:hypothetical protein
MKNLVKEASLGPLREALMQGRDIGNISKDEMRPISVQVSSALLNTISLLSCSLDVIILPHKSRPFPSAWRCIILRQLHHTKVKLKI